jgi:hypothetical protein
MKRHASGTKQGSETNLRAGDHGRIASKEDLEDFIVKLAVAHTFGFLVPQTDMQFKEMHIRLLPDSTNRTDGCGKWKSRGQTGNRGKRQLKRN